MASITLCIVAVVHAVFPLPQIISGTFPAGSRYVLHADPRATIFLFFVVLRRGRICLLHDIDGDSEFKDKAHQFRLFLLTFSSLSLVFIWHFYAKVLS